MVLQWRADSEFDDGTTDYGEIELTFPREIENDVIANKLTNERIVECAGDEAVTGEGEKQHNSGQKFQLRMKSKTDGDQFRLVHLGIEAVAYPSAEASDHEVIS